MKVQDIKEFETGEHCFGEILNINGKDYSEFKEEDILSMIQQMSTESINSSSFIRETFKLLLEYLQADMVDSSSNACLQCGSYNNYAKWVREGSETI